ncbi:MAG: RING finger protein [Oscillospiraceae bacterium]
MSNYLGARCPVCNKKFTQTDDIVVCPVCGAPHHRECYTEKGECAFEGEHLSGKTWHAPSETPPPGQEETSRPYYGRGPQWEQESRERRKVTICSVCHAENPKDHLFCDVCGHRLESAPPDAGHVQSNGPLGAFGPQLQFNPTYAVYGGLSPKDSIGEYTAHDMAITVGNSSNYYLPRFKAMSDFGRTVTPNFSAFVFGFLYFFYRKMYLVGAIVMVISAVSAIPDFLYYKENLPVMLQEQGLTETLAENGISVKAVDTAKLQRYANLSNFTFFLRLGISFIISLYANRFYYEDVKRKMKKVGEEYPEKDGVRAAPMEYEKALTKAGGTNKWLVVVSIVVGYLILGFLLVYNVIY